jgi:hypothetical protein
MRAGLPIRDAGPFPKYRATELMRRDVGVQGVAGSSDVLGVARCVLLVR